LKRNGLAVESRIITPPTLRPLPVALRDRFAGAKAAYYLVRWSAVAGKPALLEEMFLDARVFPGLHRHQLQDRSLSQLAREVYLLRAQKAEQAFAVVRLGATRARRLGLRAGTPVLKVERTVDFQRAPGALYAELFCRTDEVRFTQRLSVDSTDAVAPIEG
jgi:DNA-binding GntR family transcriptional regulator